MPGSLFGYTSATYQDRYILLWNVLRVKQKVLPFKVNKKQQEISQFIKWKIWGIKWTIKAYYSRKFNPNFFVFLCVRCLTLSPGLRICSFLLPSLLRSVYASFTLRLHSFPKTQTKILSLQSSRVFWNTTWWHLVLVFSATFNHYWGLDLCLLSSEYLLQRFIYFISNFRLFLYQSMLPRPLTPVPNITSLTCRHLSHEPACSLCASRSCLVLLWVCLHLVFLLQHFSFSHTFCY